MMESRGVPLTDDNSLTAIAASLLRSKPGEALKTVMVTSCRAKEGKTTTAINMARALIEEAGKRVLLVDGNHEAPTLHKFFDIKADLGFADLVHGRATVDQLLKRLKADDLTIMPYGSIGTRNLDFYRANHIKEILDQVVDHFDVVLMDGPSIFGKQDQGTISAAFDAVILVIECEQTPWEVVQSGKVRMEEIGAKFLGAVMNRRKYYIPRGLYA